MQQKILCFIERLGWINQRKSLYYYVEKEMSKEWSQIERKTR